MKSFGYTTVAYSHSEITVRSTDPTILPMLKTELRKFAPQLSALSDDRDKHPESKINLLPTGELYLDTFSKLGGKDREFGWWVIKTLTSQGWEPFHVDGSGDWDNLFDSKERIHMRVAYPETK